jgi:hypothetical protein
MNNDAKYIGFDVHEATISAAVRDCTGKLVMEAILETKAETILQFVQGLRGSLHVISPETRDRVPASGFLGCGGFDKLESELLSLPLEMLNL